MHGHEQKIFDSLELILAKVGEDEKIPVLIMARSAEDLPEVEKAAEGMEIKFRYRVVPAMAARATRGQIAALAKQAGVQHIEHDAEVKIMMDGANQWFGANQARADFGVTGDRDGNATGYSKTDIVIPVLELQPNSV